jgi:hypothetical protein
MTDPTSHPIIERIAEAAGTYCGSDSAFLRAVITEVEGHERRFQEHLDAWRVNSAASAERIEDLQRQLAERPEAQR